jgi:uncharacterized protein (DUF2141 family)
MIRTLLTAAAVILPVSAAAAAMAVADLAHAADLVIDVAGVRGTDGKVMVALHAPRDGVTFPDFAGAVAAQWRLAEPGMLRFAFPGLKAGRYAVAVYHDENDNGELDTNLLGIPTEGYGFSNGATGFAGPPDFDAAAVEVSDEANAAPVETATTLSY